MTEMKKGQELKKFATIRVSYGGARKREPHKCIPLYFLTAYYKTLEAAKILPAVIKQ